jgi:hypothetical protein
LLSPSPKRSDDAARGTLRAAQASRVTLSLVKPRHRLFVEHYLIDLDGGQAAIRTGCNKDANCRAVMLLRRPAVRIAIGEAMAARAARTGSAPSVCLKNML